MKTRYRLMLLSLIFAGACAFFGTRESIIAARSTSEPETISLRELIARGPDGNPNIILTDFEVLPDFAIEKKRFSGVWTKVWAPIVPSDVMGSDQQPNVQAVIFSESIENEEQAEQRLGQPQLRGVIDPESATPSIRASITWKDKFPQMDLKKCIVIVEGKQPAGVLKLAALWGGCIVLLSITFGIWYLAKKIDELPPEAAVEAEIVEPIGPIDAEIIEPNSDRGTA